MHVGKGNNSVMVRSLFKSRYWWLLHDKEEMDKVNLMWTQCRKQDIMKQIKCKLINNKEKRKKDQETTSVKIYNKLEDNYHLSNKKALFLNMRNYYEALGQNPYNSLPVTFHIKTGLDDPEFEKFKQTYDETTDPKSNIWIIKPGENTNRGNGISVSKDL